MPPLDEGSFLYMPTTMPHASIGESLDVLQLQNKMLVSIPEVESVVGKIGRADSPLDPAPISMIETFISYKSEYKTDLNGNRIKFRYDADTSEYARDQQGALIEDSSGRPFRQWRDEIRSPNDIWEKITEAADIPGTHIQTVQDVIEVAIGGRRITTTVEGRERYPVRVRYARELRDEAESLEGILVPTPMGQQIPLGQLADIRYIRGPQVIKSEDTFLLSYVLVDMKAGEARCRDASSSTVLDDDCTNATCLDSGAYIHRPRQRHHGADGNPQFRRHDHRDRDDARRPRAVLFRDGMEAQAGYRRSEVC